MPSLDVMLLATSEPRIINLSITVCVWVFICVSIIYIFVYMYICSQSSTYVSDLSCNQFLVESGVSPFPSRGQRTVEVMPLISDGSGTLGGAMTSQIHDTMTFSENKILNYGRTLQAIGFISNFAQIICVVQ